MDHKPTDEEILNTYDSAKQGLEYYITVVFKRMLDTGSSYAFERLVDIDFRNQLVDQLYDQLSMWALETLNLPFDSIYRSSALYTLFGLTHEDIRMFVHNDLQRSGANYIEHIVNLAPKFISAFSKHDPRQVINARQKIREQREEIQKWSRTNDFINKGPPLSPFLGKSQL
jgi:hypothetical protein